MTAHRVLDIGQCDYDHGNISSLLRSRFGAEVVRGPGVAGAPRPRTSGLLAVRGRFFRATTSYPSGLGGRRHAELGKGEAVAQRARLGRLGPVFLRRG